MNVLRRRLGATILTFALAAGCTPPVVPTMAPPSPGPSAAAGQTPGTPKVSDTPTAGGAECAAFGPDGSGRLHALGDVSYPDADGPQFETAAPSDVGLDAAALDAASLDVALSDVVQSFLVLRHGKLVYERYFNGSSAAEANDVHSLSKSILSVVTGIAIEDGLLRPDSQIGDFLPPNLVGEHADLTVEHLLTMSGGLEVHEPEEDVLPGGGYVQAVLARPSVEPPGTSFNYSTGLTQVLAAVLTEASGMSLCEYAGRHLLGPLGIDADLWYVEPGGYSSGGHSLFITPREIARFGQLVLDGGAYQGRQLVSRDWLDQTLAERWDLGCRNPTDPWHQGYGHLWWHQDIDGHLVWHASGFGGNELWIVPGLDMVMVLTQHTATADDPNRREVDNIALGRATILAAGPGDEQEVCPPPAPLKAFRMRPDGSGRIAITDWPAGIAYSYSPDGSQMALSLADRHLNSEIYVARPDGTGLQRLTSDLAFDNLPAWSPDGALIAFTRGDPASTDLWLVRPDGTGVRQLTDFDGFETSATWSPDGRRIAFGWGHTETRAFGASAPLWVMDAKGSNPAPLLAEDAGYPMWSPDGRSIVLELRFDNTIGVLDVDNRIVTRLRPGFVPRWSPDGSRIAFIAESNGSFDIYVMDRDGRNVHQLTNDAAFDTFPIWSPDGQTIMFLSQPA